MRMPAHSTPSYIGLRQAILWIALDLPPLAERFEVLENYPLRIDEPPGEGPHDSKKLQQLREAMKTLAAALMRGDLEALGRPMLYEQSHLTDGVVFGRSA